MAAGVNFNNVWATRGIPIDVIAIRQKVNSSTMTSLMGDPTISILAGAMCPALSTLLVKAGKDPMLAPLAQIWGYNINFGSFGQFCIAQDHVVLPKAPHLTWEEAAAPTLVGITAYRMLFGWKGNEVKEGDVVLVWGGPGGLGTQGIQLANVHRARVVAVVPDDKRGEYCNKLGAEGYINRKNFSH